MDFKHHLEQTWHLTLRFIAPLIITTLAMFGISLFTLGILGPVAMAGYTQSILMMVRVGRPPQVQDLFSEMRLFFPLLGFGFVTLIVSAMGFIMLFLPGIFVIFAITFCCLFTLPIMTDQRKGLFEAIRSSYHLALSGPFTDHLVTVVLYMAIVAIGGSFFIGSLFTIPFATIFLISIYEEKYQSQPVMPS